ncbi:hypothetical protein ACWOA0_02430 [Ignavigranum ruoffiae]|uniref:Uncharacterized protein n=1 Tax=Ignavigranum ruoffiae TaxID=89093 RepID=A0A1H9DES7_9LACT|nr:hypothetical protein [Ignavigranum ruoffiae]UPQ86254.1 hypothetical protein M0R79_02420 [Ignavigranum ruoffiae]SEQ11976.1 hypothetical protein SAMN04488558_105116 [Ignavigranum ruoffiae]
MTDIWPNRSIDQWMNQVQTYPQQATLYMAQELYHEQVQRLKLKESQLDGQLWQRTRWDQQS